MLLKNLVSQELYLNLQIFFSPLKKCQQKKVRKIRYWNSLLKKDEISTFKKLKMSNICYVNSILLFVLIYRPNNLKTGGMKTYLKIILLEKKNHLSEGKFICSLENEVIFTNGIIFLL